MFLILKCLDTIYTVILVPWVSAHEASSELKQREAGRKVIWQKAKKISLHSPHRDFKKIMTEMWNERNRDT